MSRVIASFSIVPIGVEGTSLSKYVAIAIQALRDKGVKFELTPMNTILVGDSLDEIFEAIKIAHKALVEKGIKRILVNINIDDRLDKPERKPVDKVRAVEEKLD